MTLKTLLTNTENDNIAIRDVDWKKSALGDVNDWPDTLKILFNTILNSGLPTLLVWGQHQVCLFNDSFLTDIPVAQRDIKIGRSLADCASHLSEIFRTLIQQVADQRSPQSAETILPYDRQLHPGGEVSLKLYCSLIDDPSGNNSGFLIHCTPVVKHSPDTSLQYESDRQLQFALKAANLGAWELNIATMELDASTICKKNFGQPVDLPFSYDTLRQTIHPDDRELQEKAVMRTLTTGAGYDVEYRVIWPDGSLHWVNIRGQLQGPAGQPKSMIGISIDITDRKLNEQQLKDSRAKFETVLYQAPASLAISLLLGRELIIDSPNQAFINVLGKGPDVEGKKLGDVLPELEDQPFLKLMDDVFTSGKPFEILGAPAKLMYDGKLVTRYFNISFTPLFNESNEVYAILDVSFDVTDQMIAQQRLEESETRFRIMAESTPVLISVTDNDGKATFFNRSWSNLTGLDFDELMAQDWSKIIHSKDYVLFTEQYRDALSRQIAFTSEFRLRDKQGGYRWLFAQGVPRLTAIGTFEGLIMAFTDITPEKQMQQDLQTALEQVRLSKEAAELGTFDMDLEANTLHWDERCRILFGISHDHEVTYEKDFVGGLHPDDRQRILNAIADSFSKKISDGNYDVEYRTVGADDGKIRWIRAKGKVYFDSVDKPIRFIGSVLDITEQVNAIQKVEQEVIERTKDLAHVNQALTESIKELKRSNANLEEFTHAASHDLKEPIRKILFFIDMLQKNLQDKIDETEKRLFGRIENAGKRMGNLIDDLLLYSHVSQKQHEYELVDLNQKLSRVIEDLELDIAEKNAKIVIDKLPVVHGYRRQLQQMFQNLISNALKYSKPDLAPVIKIKASQVLRDGQEYNVISIEDNGIGFEQEYAQKIFQIFFRLHGKTEFTGTGVGLSIVKKVVENHNGFIEVKSEPLVGSRFDIYLPKLLKV